MERPARAAANASTGAVAGRVGASSRNGDLLPGSLTLLISSGPSRLMYSATAFPCRAEAESHRGVAGGGTLPRTLVCGTDDVGPASDCCAGLGAPEQTYPQPEGYFVRADRRGQHAGRLQRVPRRTRGVLALLRGAGAVRNGVCLL